MGRNRASAAICAALCCAAASVAAGERIPAVTRHVNDYAGVLSAQQVDRLDEKLAAHERATSNQVVVVIVRSLDKHDLEGLSLAVAEKAGIGQKGKDNGVLLFIAVNDRKMRIEVGRGLEGVLPDIVCGHIIRDDIAPFFKEKRYFQGVDAGTNGIVEAIGGGYVPIGSEPTGPRPASSADRTPLTVGGVLAFIVVMVCHYIRRWLGAIAGGIAGLIIGFFTLGLGAVVVTVLLGALFGAFAREILLVLLFSRGGRWSSGGGGGGGFSGGGGSFSGGGASGGW